MYNKGVIKFLKREEVMCVETNENLNANLTEKTPETADTVANSTGASTMIPQETQRIDVLSELLKNKKS